MSINKSTIETKTNKKTTNFQKNYKFHQTFGLDDHDTPPTNLFDKKNLLNFVLTLSKKNSTN